MIYFTTILLSAIILISCNHLHSSKTRFHTNRNSKLNNKRFHYKASPQFLTVETESGLVLGRRINDMYGFNGIPYAKPPLGKLRFEPPQAPNRWTETWNATFDRNQCIQVDTDNLLFFPPPSGSEDCLYINVYKPYETRETPLPVMVWIHGGGFVTGNGSIFVSDDIVGQNVTLVTFNYRLGVFGFLSTNDEAAPGNIGLKDQIFALKWVQRNIKFFGGDPTKVTIFGVSAGGASVSHLVNSRLAKGLFHRAIMESGTALCPWAFSRTARQAAYEVGNKLNIHANNSRSLVNQLKNVSAYDLLESSFRVMGEPMFNDPLNGLTFAPVIEYRRHGAVISGDAYESLDKGNFNRVPQIIGYNSLEAAGVVNQYLLIFIILFNLLPSRLVPLDMNANENQLNTIGQQIHNYYGHLNGPNTFLSDIVERFASDDLFVRPSQKTVNLTSKYVPAYLYKFSYTPNPESKGAPHGEEVYYLFNLGRNSTSDRLIRKCMVKLWTDFAIYGNPTPANENACGNVTWRPLQPNDRSEMYYLNINRTTTSGQNPDRDTILFWDNLYAEYGNRPFNTY